jgi:hypothetical protein
MNPQPKPGLAYGVFKCSDARPKPELLSRFKEALENIKNAHEETGIPPETEFSVFGMEDGKARICVDGEEGLIVMVEMLELKGANFIIRSSLPGSANAIAARDLGDVFNMLYGGTELFDAENEGRSEPVMDVLFRHDETGRYVSRMELDRD